MRATFICEKKRLLKVPVGCQVEIRPKYADDSLTKVLKARLPLV